MKSEKIIICSGPSGSGKSSLVDFVLKKEKKIGFAISATSRLPRKNEKNGIDYYFLSLNEFKKKIRNNEFIEYEEVYNGIYYGTLKSEIERLNNLNLSILIDIDVKGGLNIKKKLPDKTFTIFIKPPSINELEKRLRNRMTDSDNDISLRIDKAHKEMLYSKYYDVIIENDNLEKAQKIILDKITSFTK